MLKYEIIIIYIAEAFMRKCLRCNRIMREDLEIKVTYGGYGIDIRKPGLFKMPLEEVKCAVCPECGYVETYIENTDKIKNLKD